MLSNTSEVASNSNLMGMRPPFLLRASGWAANDRTMAELAGERAHAESLESRAEALMGRFSAECRALQAGGEAAQSWFAAFDEAGDLDDLTRADLLGLLSSCPGEYLQGLLAGTCIWQIEAGRLAGRAIGMIAGNPSETADVLDAQELVLLPLLTAQWSGQAVMDWRMRFDDTDLMLAEIDDIYELAEQAPSAFAAGFTYSVIRRRREAERLISALHQ